MHQGYSHTEVGIWFLIIILPFLTLVSIVKDCVGQDNNNISAYEEEQKQIYEAKIKRQNE